MASVVNLADYRKKRALEKLRTDPEFARLERRLTTFVASRDNETDPKVRAEFQPYIDERKLALTTYEEQKYGTTYSL